jgi:ABC-2 type transport system ATP-binding protein
MIVIKELTKRYGDIEAVYSLSLTIPSGSLFGLVGPNGAGKTTTVNILTGVVRPTSGQVRILGLDLQQNPVEIKKQLGVVPEGMALFEGLTGEEHLTFVSRVYDVPREEAQRRIEDVLILFELDGVARRLIETYSQGMKKKLSFAAAIMHNPKVLFLDEPFESVDPISRKTMKEILLVMQKKGVTILLTSHALETVESLCDEVTIINKGRLVFQSKTEEIRKRIKDEISQETYQSLEEIFLDVVSDNGEEKQPKKLSWL